MNDLTNQVWGGRLLGGYAGLKFTAKKIAHFIPKCKLYVEAFAGLASVAKYVTADKMVLNDKSNYIVDYLRFKNKQAVFDVDEGIIMVEQKNIKITQMDFEDCVKKFDSDKTFFLFDPPWRTEHYTRNDKSYLDRKPSEYYKKIFELVKTMKGNWIVCGVADERQTGGYLSNHNYPKMIVESDNGVIFGKKARTLLVSNEDFVE